MEREACRARRGRGGAIVVQGQGYIAAAFRHRASRAGDPLLHTHVVVANATRAADGRWTALHGQLLYRHAKTVGFLYQSVLRAELTERLHGAGMRSNMGRRTSPACRARSSSTSPSAARSSSRTWPPAVSGPFGRRRRDTRDAQAQGLRRPGRAAGRWAGARLNTGSTASGCAGCSGSRRDGPPATRSRRSGSRGGTYSA